MKIALVNLSSVPHSEVKAAEKAINAQILLDFAPLWSTWGRMLVVDRAKVQYADAVIYLADDADQPGILGYHAIDLAGMPYGYVFTRVAQQLGESWTVTLSHEVLELLEDPTTNTLAKGPKPGSGRTVFHWWEVCDAVQAQTYEKEGVEVSNFVLPLYFTEIEERGKPTNFLGTPLRSFGIAPGGYVGYFDPMTGRHEASFADARGRARYDTRGTSAHRRGDGYRLGRWGDDASIRWRRGRGPKKVKGYDEGGAP